MPRNANQSKSTNYSLHLPDQADFIESTYSINGLTQITVSCWIKTTTNNNDEHVWSFPKTGTGSGLALQTGSNNNGLGFKCNNYAAPSVVTVQDTSFNYADGNWHNVIISSSDTKFNMYIDGVLKASTSITGAAMSGTVGKFFIGGFGSTAHPQYNVLNMSFSDVCIFDYALSDGGVSVGSTATGQIADLWGGGTSVSNPMALPSTPIAYYPLGTSAWNGNFLAENNAIGDYVFDNIVSSRIFTNINVSNLTNVTQSVWFKTSTNGQSNKQIFFVGQYGTFVLQLNGTDTLRAGITVNPLTQTYPSLTFNYADGKWHQYIMNYDGSHIKLYIDGILRIKTARTGTLRDEPTYFTAIGNISNTNSNSGAIGEYSNFIAYEHTLTDGGVAIDSAATGEIETLYNYGSPIRTLANIPQNSNLKAWYKLDASEIYNSSSTEWRIANNPYNYSTALKMWTNSWNNTPVNQTYHVANGNPRTVSAWIQIPPSKTYNACLAQAGDGTSRYNCVFWGQNFGGLSLFTPVVGNNSSDRFLYFGLNSSNIVRDHWYHIAFTDTGVDGVGRFKTYLNGEFKNQSTLNYDYGTYINGFRWAGTTNDNVLANWSGLILAHGRMYDAVLTASEIQTLYNNGTPQNINNVKSSNLKQWIAFDDQLPTVSPWTLPDLSGNNNTANLSYAPFFTSILDPINTKNGLSSGMSQTNLVQSDLQTVASYSKYAMNFDAGNADYIDLTSQIVLASELTISCWVKSDGALVYGITAGDGYPYGTADSWYRFYPTHSGGNRVDIMIDGTSTEWNFANGGTPIQNGVWQHYLLKRDSSNKWTFYLDNVKYTTNQPTISGSFRVDTFCRIYSTSPRYFEGAMSNMAIWNTSLSDSQVREVYNQGLPSNLNSFSGTAPIHWWQLGEGSSYESGWIFADEIGSINGEGQNIAETDLTNGVGTTANGTSNNMVVGDLVSDAPYSTGNAMSVNMAATARGTNVP